MKQSLLDWVHITYSQSLSTIQETLSQWREETKIRHECVCVCVCVCLILWTYPWQQLSSAYQISACKCVRQVTPGSQYMIIIVTHFVNIGSYKRLPRWLSGKESVCPYKRCRFDPWGQEDPLEGNMATHSRILPWRIPWTEEPGGLQPMGSQRVGHDLVTGHEYTVS